MKIDIEVEETVAEMEFTSKNVFKSNAQANISTISEAKIEFSNSPGLYIKGVRKVQSGRNIDKVFKKLAKANVDWSFLYRIVIETHFVQSAELYCSGNVAADIKARYGADGVPVNIDAGAALERQQLLHLPNVTGTIAFSPVRLLFGVAFRASGRTPTDYQVNAMDVNDPEYLEEDTDGEGL